MAPSHDRNPFDDLRSYASDLVDAAPSLDPSSLHLTAGVPVPKRPHHFTVPAMALMGVAAMLFFAQVGVAVVANSAVPGDHLYGLDLLVEDALTNVGVPINSSSERINEAGVLLARGDVDNAIRTARSGYRDMDRTISGITVMRLVQVEIALASGTDPGVDAAVTATLADLLKTTKNAGVIEASDVRAINEAADRVVLAAETDEDGAP